MYVLSRFTKHTGLKWDTEKTMKENSDETIIAIIEDRQNYFLFPREILCFKIFWAKVAKPHIFYKTTVVAAEK